VDGKVEVLHLDGLMGDDGVFANEEDRAVHLAISRRTSRDHAPFLDSAIDLGAWLTQLAKANRELLAGRLAGHSLRELALRGDRSISCVFQQLHTLGADLAQHAGIVVAKRKSKARGRPVAASC
jgi:predicted transcriptional regulator